MLLSIALVLIVGIVFGGLCRKIHFPPLFGMILGGILIGPYVLNLLDPAMHAVSADIRKAALIVILIRAGLKLNLSDLKKAGRPSIMMCFLPACFEIAGMILLAPRLLGLSYPEAAVLGAVTGAVSPAVIVPRMIRLIDEKQGTDKAIPQMILAGASVDDVFVIVMFTAFTGIVQGEKFSAAEILNVPLSIFTGIVIGLTVGFILSLAYKYLKPNPIISSLVMLSVGFLLSCAESNFADVFPFASMIAVMCMGTVVKRKLPDTAVVMSEKFGSLWTGAEIFLFVPVGACVSVNSLQNAGAKTILLLLCVLCFRAVGVALCMAFTPLNFKERLFCVIAYLPKATVQAAIGGIPLAMGLACGEQVLAVSVIAILLTAPMGAFAIDLSYKKLLSRDNK